MLLQSPYLYSAAATDFGATLNVYDTTTSPVTRIGQYTDGSQQALALQSSGTDLYLGMTSTLAVLDITQPSAPSLLTSVPLSVTSLSRTNSTLFAGTFNNTVSVLDISNPTQPKIVKSITPAIPKVLSKTGLWRIDPFFNIDPPNQALSVAINSGFVYVGTLNDNALVFGLDYSNPASPRLVSVYAHSGGVLTSVYSILFSGTGLFAGGSLGGAYSVSQVDMSEPFDSINQYFPPSALQSPAPPGAARSSARIIHSRPLKGSEQLRKFYPQQIIDLPPLLQQGR